jgi:RNA-directed DNA polymerase
MTWSPAVTPGSRPSRSRRSSPSGWRPGGLSSTGTRPRSCTTEGFDFLGFNVRRYRNGKLLIKPSSAAVERLRRRLAAEMRTLRGSNAAAVIAALNPVIRGWAAYYQGVASSKIFGDLVDYTWKLTYRWAKRSHG